MPKAETIDNEDQSNPEDGVSALIRIISAILLTLCVVCLCLAGCIKEDSDQPKEVAHPDVACVAAKADSEDDCESNGPNCKISLTELKLDIDAVTSATPGYGSDDLSPPHLRKEKKRPPFMVVPGLENLALFKLVTVSDEPVVGEPEQLTDGIKTSGKFDVVEGPGWVQVDLGELAEIHAIVLWHFYKNPVIFDDVIVRVSNDVNFSRDVITLFNNDHDNSAGMGKGKDTAYISRWWGEIVDARDADLTPTTARYVRVNTGLSVSGMLPGYVEIAVYGNPSSGAR